MGESKDISVIIPVFRDWDRLQICLDALAKQTLAADRFEVLVVNNGPAGPDLLPALLGNVQVLAEPKPGSYAARNTAVSRAQGEYLAFTDSDCVPDPTWLENGLKRLKLYPNARITGPVPIFREAHGGYYAYLWEFHTAFRQREIAARGKCVTANLLVGKTTFEKVGEFDSDLLSGGDIMWNVKAQAKGIRLIYDDSVSVRHPARRSLSEILAKRRRTAGSEAIFLKTSLWRYARDRLRLRKRLSLDRAPVTPAERLTLTLISWLLSIVATLEFTAVRMGLIRPKRI